MIEDTFLLLLIILLTLAIVWAIYSDKNSGLNEEFADITYNTNYNIQPGELIVAHASDNGTVHYYVVSTTSKMDYGFFKQKIDNHEYKFIGVIDPSPENDYDTSVLNVLPKIDLITGIPEYISKTSEEYELVNNLRYHPKCYKLLYSEDVNDMAPYSINRRKEQLEQPVHDIFIHTSH